MHDGRLRSLLAELLRAHGFEVTMDAALEGRSGAFYTAPVLAEKGDYAVLVERLGPDETLQAHQVAELANVVEDIGAEQGLLVHLGPIAPDASGAGAGRVVLWDESQVIHLVGNAHVHDAAGIALARLPLEAANPLLETPTQVLSDPVVPAAFEEEAFSMFDAPIAGSEANEPAGFIPETPAETEDIPVFGGIDFDAFESMDAPAAPSIAAAPANLNTAFPVLPVRLSAEEAAAKVRDRLYLVEHHQLILQPIHLLDFECDLLVEGSLRYDTVNGRVEVHGTRKDVREVERDIMEPRTAGAAPNTPLQERTLRVTTERSLELVRDAVMTAYTRVVEIQTSDDDEDVCFTERKQVAPRPDHIRIQHLGTVHRPQWQLSGPNGTLLVDAITGESVSEELRSADPGVIMLD